MRRPWLDSAQVRAAERCKAESNVAIVIAFQKASQIHLTFAYHLVYLRLILRLELRPVACRNDADLSKLHGFEERRFLRVRGNLRAEVVLVIGIRAHPVRGLPVQPAHRRVLQQS